MKIYAPDYFFPNDKTFWPSLDNAFTKDIFRFASPLFCWLIMMKTQNSNFSINLPFEENEMLSVISQTSAFAEKEN